MTYKAEEISEERKQVCTKQIENGMAYCDNCTTTSTDNLNDMCVKHLKMYGTLYP